MTKRQEAALLTRQNILDAMRKLLNEKSADSINIEDITTAANVAKGTFYTYFKRKEDAISAIAMEQYNIVRSESLNTASSAYSGVSMYLRRSAEIIEQNTLQVAQQWMKSVSAPLENENMGMDKYNFDSESIMNILSKFIEEAPAEVLTREIMANYYGAVVVWCITRGGVGLSDSIESYCENGLRASLEKYERN